MAGSGKSTAARKIEQFLWKKFEMNMNQTDFISVVPIFISLPQLKDPIYSAVEDTLKSDNYRFSDKQVQEFKEAVQAGLYKILFIMDSYDELKQEYLGSNINGSNTISKWRSPNDKGRYPKVITTSRTELFATKEYFNWFISESNNINLFQEVRLVEFNDSQIQQYIKEFYLMEVLKIIRQFSQISDPNEFKQQWSLNRKNPQIERFVQKEHQKKVEELLSQLWKPETFTSKIEDLQLQVLLVTPFMMDMVVFLLPMMVGKISNIDSIKNQFIIRYPRKNDTKAKEALDAWQFIIQNTEFLEEYQKSVVKSQKQMESTVRKYFKTQKNFESIKQSLVLEPLTSYDFYMEFFENYFNREIQKLKEQGENSDFRDELWEFTHQLANQMTFNNLSLVTFQRSGLVLKKANNDWRDQYFDDDCPEGVYKKKFRKCMPLNQKNGVFSFNHKSLQEFLVAKWFIQSIEKLEKEGFFIENNWDKEQFKGVIRFIVDKVKYSEVIQERLFKILLNTKDMNRQLDTVDKNKINQLLIQAGSNAMFILYQSDYCFRNKNLSQIYIQDINLAGINFFRTMLVRSTFKNVDLSLSNLNLADLRQCQWNQIRINERPTLFDPKREGKYKALLFPNNSETIIGLKYVNNEIKGKVEQWNISEGKQVITSTFDNLTIKLMVKSLQDQSNLISFVDDNNIYILNISLNRMTHKIEYGHLKIDIFDLTFSYDDRTLIWCNQQGLFKIQITLVEQTEQIGQNQIDEEKTFQQIHLLTEKIEQLFEGEIQSIQASRKYILAISRFKIWIYDSQDNIFLPQNVDRYRYSKRDQLAVKSKIKEIPTSISIDGQMMATGGQDKIINLYQIDNLSIPKYLKGHQNWVEQLQFFSSNKHLVSASSNEVILWDLQTQIRVNKFEVQSYIGSIAVQYGSMLLALSIQQRSRIKLYDMELSDQLDNMQQGHSDEIKICSSSNNGGLLASSDYKVIKLWDLSIGKQIGKTILLPKSFLNDIDFLEFTNDEQFLFCALNRTEILQWNVATQIQINSFDFEKELWKKMQILFFNQNQIISIEPNSIKLWDLNQKKYKQLEYIQNNSQNCIMTLNEKQYITVILQTGYETVLGTNDGELIFLNENDQKSNTTKFHTNYIIKIIGLKDDFCYVSAGMDQRIVISKQGIQQHSILTDYLINDIVLFKDQIICCDTRIIIYSINSDEPPKYLELEATQNILNLELDLQHNQLYMLSELGRIYKCDLCNSKLEIMFYFGKQQITKIKWNFIQNHLIALKQNRNIDHIIFHQIYEGFQSEYPVIFIELLEDNYILLGHENNLSLWQYLDHRFSKKSNFGNFQNLKTMAISFDKSFILVSDKNQLIKINIPSFITYASLNKQKNCLILGENDGLVFQQNLEGIAKNQSQWQGNKESIEQLRQSEEMVAVGYNKLVIIINWNTKEIIYEIKIQEKQKFDIDNGKLLIQSHYLTNNDNDNNVIIDLASKQNIIMREINGRHFDIFTQIILSKDHLIVLNNKLIKIYEYSSSAFKFVFSVSQQLECDQTIIQEPFTIKTKSGIDLKQLIQERGAQLLLQQVEQLEQ